MKLYSKILIISTLFASVSCQELVDPDGDLNINPNNPTQTSYENVLITGGVGQIILQNGETARLAGIFGGTHRGVARQYAGSDSYSVTTGDFNGIWDDLFIHSYRNAKLAEELATEEGITGITIGISQVHQALALGSGTSLYGDIPFDELADLDVENPSFEGQAVVYGKIQSLLDDAIANLQAGGGTPAIGSDIFFDGDNSAWVEVAYTLKARYYMHTKEYANAYAAAQNGISSSANNMMAPYGEALDASNLNWQLWENETQGDDIVVSDFIVSMVAPEAASPDFTNYRGNAKTNETARFNYLFATNENGFQPNPATNAFAGQTSPSPMVTYEENLLILAEAGLRSTDFTSGLVQLNAFRDYMSSGGYLWESAEPANIQYDPYTAADFAAGGMENTDGLSPDNALLREILEERYVTLFSQIEIFNDVRRTSGENAVRVPVVPNTGNQLPERFLYPQTEIDRNENTPSPIPDLFEPTEVNQ